MIILAEGGIWLSDSISQKMRKFDTYSEIQGKQKVWPQGRPKGFFPSLISISSSSFLDVLGPASESGAFSLPKPNPCWKFNIIQKSSILTLLQTI